MSIFDNIRDSVDLAAVEEITQYRIHDAIFATQDEADQYALLTEAQLKYQNDYITWEELQSFYADFVRYIYQSN
jgi:hypothetical protein